MKGWGRSVVKATGFCFISDDGNQFKGNDFKSVIIDQHRTHEAGAGYL